MPKNRNSNIFMNNVKQFFNKKKQMAETERNKAGAFPMALPLHSATHTLQPK